MNIDGLDGLVPIGDGGFSKVYRATDLANGPRTVAVKVLNLQLTGEVERQRFTAECNAMARLSYHDYIVPLFWTTMTDDGYPAIVMQYMPGGPIAAAMSPRGAEDAVLDAGVKVAAALHAAHEIQVLHRDIKPSNILISPTGQPGLADFGISVVADAMDGRAASTATVGLSYPYAAPEKFDGVSSEKTDLYSLAATYYRLLAGRAPFDVPSGTTKVELVRRILTEEAPSLVSLGCSPAVDRLIRLEGLAKDPDDRPASAREFGQRLRELQRRQGHPVTDWIEEDRSSQVAFDSAVGKDAAHPDDESLTVIVGGRNRGSTQPTPEPVEERESTPFWRGWDRRSLVALGAGATALLVVLLLVLFGGGDSGDSGGPTITSTPIVETPTVDDYFNTLRPPQEVRLERTDGGIAMVSWVNPNDEDDVQFEIQRVDAAGAGSELVVAASSPAELPLIGDADSPCIVMRALAPRGVVSRDIAEPVCLAASIGSDPLVRVVPDSCVAGACAFRFESSGYFRGGQTRIEITDPEGIDPNARFAGAYATSAEISPDGIIDWEFAPGPAALVGEYRVRVIDVQSGLASSAAFELVEP